MRTTEVTLTPEQELRAATVGFELTRNALVKGYKSRHYGASRWGGGIESSGAELAVSILLELPWTAAERTDIRAGEHIPDVGDAVEVRLSQALRGVQPSLYFDAERDFDDRFYVLCSGFMPTFRIHGFILGMHARRAEWRHTYPERTVYRVPANELEPVRDRRRRSHAA